jgi:hypothetical protein
VARWFFTVGGAAGTVAKTISAYDMAVSDAFYGSTPRYVSRQRLEAMLEHEFVKLRNALESVGRLFKRSVKMYVYPTPRPMRPKRRNGGSRSEAAGSRNSRKGPGQCLLIFFSGKPQ